MDWQKTSKEKVLDYIVKFEKFHRDNGVKNLFPTDTLLGHVFGISRQRANQYKKELLEKVEKLYGNLSNY